MNRKAWLAMRRIVRRLQVFLVILLVVAPTCAHAQSDPMPSWNDCAVKASITGFVARVTAQGQDFVPGAERIATFDNDGTLWAEQPIYFQLPSHSPREGCCIPRSGIEKARRFQGADQRRPEETGCISGAPPHNAP
jgi:hypothetical protein